MFKDENIYDKVRKEVFNYLTLNKNQFLHQELETEIGLLNFQDYLNYIKNDGSWAGEIEKYAVEEIYNINLADYIQINNNSNIYHEFLYDCNHDNNYRKHLFILTNINNNHYNLIFDEKYKCFKNKENKLIYLYNFN